MSKLSSLPLPLALVSLVLLACMASACTTSGASANRSGRVGDDESIVGKPPTARDDPFFFVAMPAEAVPAAPSGTLGLDDPAPASASAPPDRSPPAKSGPESDTNAGPVAAPALPSEPEAPAPVAALEPAPTARQGCFSCVKLCTVEGDCDAQPDNLICGWGTSPDADEARTLARAQCDAALDMARQMPIYSRIEGHCPPAACR